MTELRKKIDYCKKCLTILSTVDLIEEGYINKYDMDGHLSSISLGHNLLRCPKCFNIQKTDITINEYNGKKIYLTKKEELKKIEADRIHKKFFP